MNFMKKKVLCMILASIFCLCGLGMLAGCGEASNPSGEGTDYLSPVLTAEEERMIKEAYVDFYRDIFPKIEMEDLVMEDYYGEYNGAHVVKINHQYLPLLEGSFRQTVAGLDFRHFSCPKISVYKNQEFYFLQQAYEKEWLTYDDLVELYNLHKQKHGEMYSDN